MILEELYIDGQQVDIKDISIVRRYQTPYFSDISKVLMDTTQTITLPQTERNKAIMKYLHEADMSTDFPYTIHYANYYMEGLHLIRNGEVKVLGDFEIQIVYGIDREKYLPLKETKLNEIVPNGTTILEGDWVSIWNKNYMFLGSYKFKYLNYISGERESDVEIIGGVPQPKVEAPEPYLSNLKEMSLHPFVPFDNILDLITTNFSLSPTLFDELKDSEIRGLILGGNKGNNSIEQSTTYTDELIQAELPFITALNSIIKVSSYGSEYFLNELVLGLSNVKITVNVDITSEAADPLEDWMNLRVYLRENGTDTVVYTFNRSDRNFTGECTFTIKNYGDSFFIKSDELPLGDNIVNGTLTITATTTTSTYDMTDDIPYPGKYNCLLNLPNETPFQFLSNLCKMYAAFIGFDSNRDLKVFKISDFVTNIQNGTVYDWSGRISNVRKSDYQFNGNAQKNWLKYANDKDTLYPTSYDMLVSDTTLPLERDLYVVDYDIPKDYALFYGKNQCAILPIYKQRVAKTDTGVTFENQYIETKPNAVRDDLGVATVSGVSFRPFTAFGVGVGLYRGYYTEYKKIINRPIIKECNVNLDFYESTNIDFTKPIYISEWGKYCMLLELTAPNKGLCEAKLLLINQTL